MQTYNIGGVFYALAHKHNCVGRGRSNLEAIKNCLALIRDLKVFTK